jgi:uncharacterized protein (DUF3084 family)
MGAQLLATPESQEALLELLKSGPGVPAMYVWLICGTLTAAISTLFGLLIVSMRGHNTDLIKAKDQELTAAKDERQRTELEHKHRVQHLEALLDAIRNELAQQNRERLEEAREQTAALQQLEGVSASNNEVANGIRNLHQDLRNAQQQQITMQTTVHQILAAVTTHKLK